MKIFEKNIDLGLLILRLSIGILMLLHGIAKLMHGADGIGQMLESSGLPVFIMYGVYIGEVVAPLFIIAGVGTRVAAAVFAFNMIIAVAIAHSSDIFTLSESGGWTIELQALYFFSAVVLVFTGAGRYALSSKKIWD
ncbi:DoxX family protein [Prevotella sp. 10(H)]|uniref:DoxX family protein n=1 Tax=Prevotella sp. 10(H) TaxID=1158294 RepID=UPI0004A758B0|nr:DoxX family protein [Prevotella sp. 10(H)]